MKSLRTLPAAIAAAVLAVGLVGPMSGVAQAASDNCVVHNPPSSSLFDGGSVFGVDYATCTDGTFQILDVYYLNSYARYAHPVIMRYQPNWGTPAVINWSGDLRGIPANYNTTWDAGGRHIEQSLHPYVYIQYSANPNGPWTASPIIRLT